MNSIEQRVTRYISEYSGQGDHLTGSSADLANALWMAAVISESGAEPLLNEYIFSRLAVNRATVNLGKSKIDGLPLYDSGQTTPDGVRGTLGMLGADSDIGMILLSSQGDKSINELHAARRKGNYKALIAVTGIPGDKVAPINAEDFINPYGPPVLQVANSHWHQLREVAASGHEVSLQINTTRVESRLVNVGARIAGTDSSLDPIVVMTPRSGWWRCASERGGGIACYFEIMAAALAAKLPRDIIFTANSGHELGHLGLDLFLDANPELVRNASTWVHLGANFAAKGVDARVLLQYSDAALRELASDVMKPLKIVPDWEMPIGQRPLGEARNVFDDGGRYISILGSNPLFHHPSDTWPDAVDLPKTCAWIRVLVELVIKLGKRS